MGSPTTIKKPSGLSVKQFRFVCAYLQGSSKTESYRTAYSCENMKESTIRRRAIELAVLPKVAGEINLHFEDVRAANLVTSERVIEEIASLAFSDYSDFVKISDGKYQVQNIENLTREQRLAIKSIRPVQTSDGPQIEIDLYSKLDGLNQLVKTLGLNEKKPPPEAQQVHIFLNMKDGDTPRPKKPIDVTPVQGATERDEAS